MQTLSDTEKKLVSAAKVIIKKSYAPYTEAYFGSALLTSNGKIYSGTNVENVSLGLTICSERCAVVKAVNDGELKIRAIAVVTPENKAKAPCGACLQVLAEFVESNETRFILANLQNENFEVRLFKELVPYPCRIDVLDVKKEKVYK